MKSFWSEHKGTRFLYADYSSYGRNLDALRLELDHADTLIEREPGNDTLVLVDIRHTVTSTQVVSLMKESAARTKGRVARLAVVGVTGVQRILATAVARFSHEPLQLFDDVEAAKEWLVAGGEGGRRIAVDYE